MLSVVGKASTIVEAMQAGASDYLNKPFEEDELEITIRKVLEIASAPGRARSLVRRALDAPRRSGRARPCSDPGDMIDQISDTDVTVLIQGESGVGKEIVARTVHEQLHARRASPSSR